MRTRSQIILTAGIGSIALGMQPLEKGLGFFFLLIGVFAIMVATHNLSEK